MPVSSINSFCDALLISTEANSKIENVKNKKINFKINSSFSQYSHIVTKKRLSLMGCYELSLLPPLFELSDEKQMQLAI
jgi:hypothetical protein